VSFDELAAARRTHKAFGPEPVARETLVELLELARLAPNHHLTQPWRFRVLGPESLERLKEAGGPSEALKLDRAPTLVVASAALAGELVQDEEDICATAAAITLVLLGATERGLAAGVPHGERVLGLIHLGPAEREPAPRERDSVESYVEFLP
jgi:nitroreductase